MRVFAGARRAIGVRGLCCVVALSFAASAAAPDAELWERWTAHDEQSEWVVDHLPWDDFLGRNVTEQDGVHLVRYGSVSESDRELLREYLESLAAVRVSEYNRGVQRAYWINLYNALTIDLVIGNFPVESIRDISDGLFSPGPWTREIVMVEGVALSLNDIEHRILRSIWKDARIHYAVNCASIGCPNLARQAYTARNMEMLLDLGAKRYVNHPRGVWFEDGDLHVSSIYSWFADDFGANDAEIIGHLLNYAEPELKSRLEEVDSIDGHGYDWSLNDA